MPSISDEIRVALDKPDGVSEEIMVPLSAQYDQEVAAVNERLDEAVMLLRKNLRSEAIQSANRRPNVIDAAARLDFPEVGEWIEILQFLGVKVPRRLDLEKVQQINEAIVEEQPIEELLRQHRRLAIARAPLNWRLVVLRRIADADPMNPSWMEDVEAYERERLKTLRSDVENALKEKDMNAVHHLHSELAKQKWVTEVPGDLEVNLKKAIVQHEYEGQLESLGRLSEELHEAFSGFDEGRARSLVADWNTQCSALKGPLTLELQESVAPTVAWLEELDQYAVVAQQRDAALQKLEDALDRERDPTRLHKAHAAAARFDEPVPADLEQRYRVLQEQIALTSKRKTQFKLASVIAATLLVAVLVGAWQLRKMRVALVAETTASFRQLVDKGRNVEAQAFWEKTLAQDESLTQQPEMVRLNEKLLSQISTEKERQREFESYLSKADSEDAQTIDVKALNEAERIAVTEEEKSRVFKVQEKFDRYQKALTVKHTESALAEVEKARKRLAVLEKMEFEILDLDELDELIVGLTELSRLYPRRSGEVDAQVRLVQTKAENLDDSVQDFRRAEMVRQQARRPLEQARTVEAYQSALDRYVRTVKSNSLSSELTRSASESSIWEKGLATNELSDASRKLILDGLSADDISQLVDRVSDLQKSTAKNPILDEFREVMRLIGSAADKQTEAINTLNDRIDRLPYGDLVTILADDARDGSDLFLDYKMYISDYQRVATKLMSEDSGSMGIKRVSNVNGGVSSSVINVPMQRAHVEPGATMKWLEGELENRQEELQTNFERTLVRLAREVSKRTDLDRRIKEHFLALLIQCGVDGSVTLSERLGEAAETLRGRDAMRRLWFEPSRPSDQLDAEVISSVISALDVADADLPDPEEMLRACSNKRYTFAGFIDRNQAGVVSPVLHMNPEGDAVCYLMCADVADPTQAEILEVGNWVDGELKLESDSTDIAAGRPLFFISE